MIRLKFTLHFQERIQERGIEIDHVRKAMNIKYDRIADAIYMKVSQAAVAQTVKLDDALLVDKDSEGNIVGLEILDASSQENLIQNLEKNVLGGVPVDMTFSTPIFA